jgi:hypothetical protein
MFFSAVGTVGVLVLAGVLLLASFRLTFTAILSLVALWAVLAYVALPRIHQSLAAIYIPKYYLGRARTSDGLLGDPINIALMGTPDQLVSAMRAAGWTRADEVTWRSSWRIVTATLRRRSYHHAPVSPLFLFGRQQDVAFQLEVQGNPAKRHHVRFWRTPDGWLLPGGRKVDWLAAASYDRAVGLSFFTLQVTHRIDADIDVERDFTVASLMSATAEIDLEVLEDFTTGYHSRNGGGDQIRTDGDLPVVDLRRVQPRFAFRSAPPPRHPPIPVWAGVGAAGLATIWAVAVLAAGRSWAGAEGLAGPILSMNAVLSVALLGLSPFLLRRRNWARVAMLATALAAVPAFGARSWLASQAATSQLIDHVGIAAPVLVLIVLSGDGAREWCASRTSVDHAQAA